MEEVDSIIIPILRQIGCNFKADVKSIKQFATDDIVQSCSYALHAINAQYKFPIKLPEGNAQRFRICTNLANAIAELGYTGENGYQAFLYPNEHDMRKLLSWLVGRLPKPEEQEEETEEISANAVLNKAIMQSLKEWSARIWHPLMSLGSSYRGPRGFSASPICMPSQDAPAATKTYYRHFQPLLSLQLSHRELYIPSVLEHNTSSVSWASEQEKDWEAGDIKAVRSARAAELKKSLQEAFAGAASRMAASGTKMMNDLMSEVISMDAAASSASSQSTRLNRQTKFGQQADEIQAQVVVDGVAIKVTEGGETAVDEDEDTMRKKQEEELSRLQADIARMSEDIARLERNAEEETQAARMVESQIASTAQSVTALEQSNQVKQTTLALLPDAEKNIAKLKEISAASAQRLIALAQEWEEHRAPLLAKYRRKKQQLQDRKDESRVKLDQIKRMRAEMKDMAHDIREKDVLHAQVTEELNKLPKSINRQVYVQRIMDIVKTLEKQKQDMNKILTDVRSVQKDINTVSETSKRSFAVTDEIIFQTANKDKRNTQATQAYKCLAQLRKGFDKLVQSIEDMGRIKNESRELTARIEAIESRNTNLNMERIKADLTAVKKENKTLQEQLQALAAQGVVLPPISLTAPSSSAESPRDKDA